MTKTIQEKIKNIIDMKVNQQIEKPSFRSWDRKNKWMDDDFFIYSDGGEMYTSDVEHYDTPHTEIDRVEENNYVVMEYTGKKDKNNVKIFDKDIIKTINEDNTSKIFMVDKDSFYTGFKPFNKEREDFNHHDVEVIGNIYANPEMIQYIEE